ncbi:hypothetical protein IE53DRAFT_176558 [Violaceomyces palustris]|uniref:Uncharacterized protein n=1 Tax=Violaceomyces palustris TaxID=1673888 RepID=A0ACD0NSM9_9BASI|nr:hypothetical protein IE53DRAFT_176558 [Violaceomyces palustris]
MPRIPVRVEPYSSPSRQHRHYKNKRDQVLRALGKAAYINGSHFAIMWVSARGDVETYASEALQGRLEDWFVKGGIAEEAKELVTGSMGQTRSNPFTDSRRGSAVGADDLSEDEGLGEESLEFTDSPADQDDPFLDTTRGGLRNGSSSVSSRSKFERRSSSKAIAPLDTSAANDHYLRSRGLGGPRTAGLLTDRDENSSLAHPPKSAPLMSSQDGSETSFKSTINNVARLPLSRTASNSHAPQFEVRFQNMAARTAFFELRFGQLQQGVCKTVAKAWIKIIEPKKQTRCPYNKGEEGKPSWWPEGVRHKEPDHLMKPERHSLLLTILRSPKVQVARLQLATAEVVALIKADKVSLLMDVYRIAREEEKMRESKVDPDTPMTVGVSTLEGWSDSEQGPTSDGLDPARSVSPEPTAASSGTAGASSAEKSQPSKKRNFSSTAMSKSASTSAVMAASGGKRRSLAALGGSTSEGPESSMSTRRFSSKGGTAQHPSWLMQEAAQNNMRQHPSSAACGASSYGNGQDYEQVHGLVTPLTGSTQLMDPAYMQAAAAAAASAAEGGGEHFGYGSNLYFGGGNHEAAANPRQAQDSMYAYHPSSVHGGISVVPQHGQENGFDEGSQSMHPGMGAGGGSALGLHGVPLPPPGGWGQLEAFNNQFEHDPRARLNVGGGGGSVDDGPGGDLSSVDQRQQHAMPPQPQLGSVELPSQPWPSHPSSVSGGDNSFNTSFDSSGPKTPSPMHNNGSLRLSMHQDGHHNEGQKSPIQNMVLSGMQHHHHHHHQQQQHHQMSHHHPGPNFGLGMNVVSGMMQDQQHFDAWVRSQTSSNQLQ